MRLAIGITAALLLAGCSSGSSGSDVKVVTPPSCISALNAADQGFTALAHAITQTKQAFDVGMSGHPAQASAMLRQIQGPSPTRYKQLEAECRDAG